MKGKFIEDLREVPVAFARTNADFLLLAVPGDGMMFEDGFYVIIKPGEFEEKVSRLKGFLRASPPEFMAMYLGNPQAPHCYHVEAKPGVLLAALRSTGEAIELEE